MIIGLCGYSKVGKDTVAAVLENYTRLAFADALKCEVSIMLASQGFDVNLWGEDKEQWRDLLVLWGRKRRALDADYWIKQMFMRHVNQLRYGRSVITDVRYANEAKWITDRGGLVIRLQRPGIKPANEEEYMSFKALDEIPMPVVNNDGTPEQAAALIRTLIKEHNIHQHNFASDIGW